MLFHPKQHFITNPFEYTVDKNNMIFWGLLPVFILFAYVVLTIFVSMFDYGVFNKFLMIIALVLFLPLVIGGFKLYLFFNYYFYSRNLYLQISKGQSTFYFGPKDSYKEYSKDDILNITKFQNVHNRNRKISYAVNVIDFRNGEQIKFPSLLLDDSLFSRKFAGYQINEMHKFIPSI